MGSATSDQQHTVEVLLKGTKYVSSEDETGEKEDDGRQHLFALTPGARAFLLD